MLGQCWLTGDHAESGMKEGGSRVAVTITASDDGLVHFVHFGGRKFKNCMALRTLGFRESAPEVLFFP